MPSVGQKIPKLRSPNYPGIDLGVAVERTKRLFAAINRHTVGVEVAFKSMGYSPKSSSGLVAMGALRAFGLIDDVKGSKESMVKLSDRGLDIAVDFSEGSTEWWDAVKKAAVSPKIHNELWVRYGPILPPQDELRRFLIREKAFIDNGATAFIAEYRKTIEFAKLTNDDTIEEGNEPDNEEVEADTMDKPDAKQDRTKSLQDNPRGGGFSAPKPPSGTRDFPLYTSRSRGALYVPEEMTKEDFELLEVQIKNSLAVIKATAVVAGESE